MIGYVTIGALDTEKSGAFYDAVLGAVGHERKFSDGGWLGYGPKGEDSHSVYVCPPFDKKPASVGRRLRRRLCRRAAVTTVGGRTTMRWPENPSALCFIRGL